MDPDEVLRQMRDAIYEFIYAEEGSAAEADGAAEAAGHAQALDQWIMHGGFLPDDWQQHATRRSHKP